MANIADDDESMAPVNCLTSRLRCCASQEHERLQSARPSERLRAVLQRALTAREPGPSRVLLREELRRAEGEMAALAEVIGAAREVLEMQAVNTESPDEQGYWPSSPLHEAAAAVPPLPSHPPSEPSSSSSSSCEVNKSLLDRQVDAWLRQERFKNLAQPARQAPSSNGGESLLYRESLARLDLDAAKSHASSDGQLPNGLRSQADPAIRQKAKGRMLLDDQKSSASHHETNESLLLRKSLMLQGRNRALSNVQRLVLEAQRANSLEELCNVRDGLAMGIEAAKRHDVMEADLAKAEALRRRVHNAIQDLKGSIRVYCCVRPMSSKELAMGDTQAVTSIDSMTVQVQNLWERSTYNFDAVFSPARQEDIYKNCRDLIQSAFDGHNVAIFAYGQTSAGKTHTIFGEPGRPGLAPRIIHQLYSSVKKQSGRFAHTITGSMLELYRNDLVDLLDSGNGSPGSDVPKKLCIRVDKRGSVHIENLSEEVCQTADDLEELLEYGHRRRTTRATAMNAQSSRSHVFFTIRIGQVNLETGEELRGKITVCDLAGSERLKRAMVSGEGAKEAIEINRSLTALGDVVAALRQGHKQIPYRNHKLTQLMQDSLGQESKVLMFVNCSPASSNVDETLTSLKYAVRAKNIKRTATPRGRRASDVPVLTSSASEPSLAPSR